MGRKRDLHGSYSTYVNHKCRCEKCKMARRDYMRSYRAKKKEALALTRAETGGAEK